MINPDKKSQPKEIKKMCKENDILFFYQCSGINIKLYWFFYLYIKIINYNPLLIAALKKPGD